LKRLIQKSLKPKPTAAAERATAEATDTFIPRDICVRLLLIVRRKQHRSSETEDEINERLSRVPGAVFAEWGFNYLKVLMAVTSVGIFFLVSTGLFATKVYPRIWFSLGAGRLVRWCLVGSGFRHLF
jgi:hypothetical protein